MHQLVVIDVVTLRGIVKISQCQSSYLAWVHLFDPKRGVRYWEKIIFLF